MAEKTEKTVNSLQDMIASAQETAQQPALPPVHLWNPPFCGDMDLEIRADGSWIHEGRPITRPQLVRLFASILRRDGDEYFLVTPAEKLRIRVQDAPFLAVDVDISGDDLIFTTNMGDRITAGPDHPVTVAGSADQPRPYLHVRRGLHALIDRKTFYRLADLARPAPDGGLALRSGGIWMALEV